MLCISLKKGFILQSKGAHFQKICGRAIRTAKFFPPSASRGTAWPLHFKFASYAYVINKIVCSLPSYNAFMLVVGIYILMHCGYNTHLLYQNLPFYNHFPQYQTIHS